MKIFTQLVRAGVVLALLGLSWPMAHAQSTVPSGKAFVFDGQEVTPQVLSRDSEGISIPLTTRGDVVESGNIFLSIPQDIDGASVNWITGDAVPTYVAGYHFNPYFNNVQLTFWWGSDMAPDIAGVADAPTSSEFLVLQEGDEVGPESIFSITNNPGPMGWASGADGYLGFRFNCAELGVPAPSLCYGYVHLITEGGAGDGYPATIISYAYNSMGNAIVIGGGGGGEVITMAEARDLGPGTTVTVEGVVSRAMGAFSYFQDDTAGLSLRETSGPFFDAVAAGDVTEGTRVQVTGTLSEFNGLIQINQGEMDSFEILGQGEEVVAQDVSLDDLTDSAYQAELVRITGLNFVDASGEFAASTSYDVTDGTTTMELRIPNASDTEMVGLPIPENTFTFTGVIGSFNAPQLMAIFEGDVSKSSSNEGNGSDLAFDLFQNYPNPFVGTTTISFELPVASQVTVEVLDVTGRRVALLVDEHMSADTHTVEWNANGFANGVYFYRMQADGFSKTLRTTLVR